MRFFKPLTGTPDAYCEPYSMNGPPQDERFVEPPLKIAGDAKHYNHRDGNDDYRQVTALFNLFDAGQRQRLFTNSGVPKEIVRDL